MRYNHTRNFKSFVLLPRLARARAHTKRTNNQSEQQQHQQLRNEKIMQRGRQMQHCTFLTRFRSYSRARFQSLSFFHSVAFSDSAPKIALEKSFQLWPLLVRIHKSPATAKWKRQKAANYNIFTRKLKAMIKIHTIFCCASKTPINWRPRRN